MYGKTDGPKIVRSKKKKFMIINPARSLTFKKGLYRSEGDYYSCSIFNLVGGGGQKKAIFFCGATDFQP